MVDAGSVSTSYYNNYYNIIIIVMFLSPHRRDYGRFQFDVESVGDQSNLLPIYI